MDGTGFMSVGRLLCKGVCYDLRISFSVIPKIVLGWIWAITWDCVYFIEIPKDLCFVTMIFLLLYPKLVVPDVGHNLRLFKL